MGTLNQAKYMLVVFAVSLLFTGCGATEFGASTEMRDGKKAALVGSNGKADGADGADDPVVAAGRRMVAGRQL